MSERPRRPWRFATKGKARAITVAQSPPVHGDGQSILIPGLSVSHIGPTGRRVGKITLATLAIALGSGILAVGRIGGDVVANVAVFVFLPAVLLLGVLLASYWGARWFR